MKKVKRERPSGKFRPVSALVEGFSIQGRRRHLKSLRVLLYERSALRSLPGCGTWRSWGYRKTR